MTTGKIKGENVGGGIALDATESMAFDDLSDMPGGAISVGAITGTSLDAGLAEAGNLNCYGTSNFGAGGFVNSVEITSTGDLTFKGTGGLPYGCIDGEDETITCTTQNTWYQVTFDTVGAYNNTTPSTAGNDITINKTGDYMVAVTACLHTANAQDIEVMIKKENGTADLGPHLFQTTGVAGKIENMSGNCIAPITATDTLEVWVRCTSAAAIDVIFDHMNLNCVQLGG